MDRTYKPARGQATFVAVCLVFLTGCRVLETVQQTARNMTTSASEANPCSTESLARTTALTENPTPPVQSTPQPIQRNIAVKPPPSSSHPPTAIPSDSKGAAKLMTPTAPAVMV